MPPSICSSAVSTQALRTRKGILSGREKGSARILLCVFTSNKRTLSMHFCVFFVDLQLSYRFHLNYAKLEWRVTRFCCFYAPIEGPRRAVDNYLRLCDEEMYMSWSLNVANLKPFETYVILISCFFLSSQRRIKEKLCVYEPKRTNSGIERCLFWTPQPPPFWRESKYSTSQPA